MTIPLESVNTTRSKCDVKTAEWSRKARFLLERRPCCTCPLKQPLTSACPRNRWRQCVQTSVQRFLVHCSLTSSRRIIPTTPTTAPLTSFCPPALTLSRWGYIYFRVHRYHIYIYIYDERERKHCFLLSTLKVLSLKFFSAAPAFSFFVFLAHVAS